MRLFNAYGRFVTRKSGAASGVIVAITALAVVGFSITDAFLPDGSELVAAQEALDESFPGSAGLEGMQIIFRGDVLTPEGLATVREVTESAANDTELGRFVDRSAGMSSTGHLFAALTGDPTIDLRSLDQAQIDATLEAASSDEAVAALILPLGLAGGTTIISFLTNLFGDIPGLADFGVVAAVGVSSGLFIFLTFNPAVKSILDGRRSTAGRPIAKQLIGDSRSFRCQPRVELQQLRLRPQGLREP